MIFVDYLGVASRLAEVRAVVEREVAAAMRIAREEVRVRRVVTEQDREDEVELWIELSTDEQLYRLGRPMAQRITDALRASLNGGNVWVMYRVVPLSHAFLNGDPRGRGTGALD